MRFCKFPLEERTGWPRSSSVLAIDGWDLASASYPHYFFLCNFVQNYVHAQESRFVYVLSTRIEEACSHMRKECCQRLWDGVPKSVEKRNELHSAQMELCWSVSIVMINYYECLRWNCLKLSGKIWNLQSYISTSNTPPLIGHPVYFIATYRYYAYVSVCLLASFNLKPSKPHFRNQEERAMQVIDLFQY